MYTIIIRKGIFQRLMVKRGKNPAELTNQDREAINQMLLMWGAELSRFSDSHPLPEKRYQEILKDIRSRKNIGEKLLSFNLDEDDLCDARDLNKKLAEYTGYGKLNSKDGSKRYLDDQAMSKALRALVDKNLLLPTTGKEALKKIRHSQGEKRYREYKERYARGGFISTYEIPPDVAQLRKIMSKPLVAETFHSILRRYSPFQEYIKILLDCFLYMNRNVKDEKEKFYELFKGFNLNLQMDSNEWEQYRKWLGSLEKKQLELVKEKISCLILENPVVLHDFLYRLYKLPLS
jgi:hypothetical protein